MQRLHICQSLFSNVFCLLSFLCHHIGAILVALKKVVLSDFPLQAQNQQEGRGRCKLPIKITFEMKFGRQASAPKCFSS